VSVMVGVRGVDCVTLPSGRRVPTAASSSSSESDGVEIVKSDSVSVAHDSEESSLAKSAMGVYQRDMKLTIQSFDL